MSKFCFFPFTTTNGDFIDVYNNGKTNSWILPNVKPYPVAKSTLNKCVCVYKYIFS